jgi:hypothetical protein
MLNLGENGNRQSASLYDMIPAKPQNSKPYGQWNKAKIMVYKGTVVHGQNGKNVYLNIICGLNAGTICCRILNSVRLTGRWLMNC